jgi:hypothetical protein
MRSTFLIFVFFPYFSFVNLGTDMQPYAVVIACIMLLFRLQSNLTKIDILLLIILLVSLLTFFASTLSFSALRSLFNYVSLFSISFIGYRVIKSREINFEYFLKVFTSFWILVGVLQKFFDINFLTFLIASTRTTEDRGVTSLASEPTTFGVVLIFLSLFFIHSEYSGKIKYIVACFLSVIFLAQSAMSSLFLLILTALYLFTHSSIKSLALVVVAILASYFLVDMLVDSRLLALVSMAINNPSLLINDASVNDRLFHLYYSLVGAFDNLLFPNGFDAWSMYSKLQIQTSQNVFKDEWISIGDRIMSGYGAVFFELGLTGLILPYIFFVLYRKIYINDMSKAIMYFLFINTIMFSAIPVGLSFFALYISYLTYLAYPVVSHG